jgi:hypothetical protein
MFYGRIAWIRKEACLLLDELREAMIARASVEIGIVHLPNAFRA